MQIKANFIRVAHKDGCNMFRALTENKPDGEWINCPENVKIFAKANFKEGDEVILTVEEASGKYTASKMELANGTSKPAPEAEKKDEPSKSETKIPNPAQQTSSKSYSSKMSPEESAKIARLSVFSSACTAVQTLTGQVDPNNIADVIEAIYEKGIELVNKG